MSKEGIIKKSGEKCPSTGVWETVHPNKGNFFIKKDQIFPEYDGQTISWILTMEQLKN